MATTQDTTQRLLFPETETIIHVGSYKSGCNECVQTRWREATTRRRHLLPHEKKWHREHSSKKRLSYIARLTRIKIQSGCIDCGYKHHHVALDFDHVTGIKRRGLPYLFTYSEKAIQEELAKCVVRCANCHRIRSKTSRDNGEFRIPKKENEATQKALVNRMRRIKGNLFLTEAKMASGCVDCGYCDNSSALDFDHVRGTKSFKIASSADRSIATLTEEIDKCEVVCANCHRIRTFERHQLRKVQVITI